MPQGWSESLQLETKGMSVSGAKEKEVGWGVWDGRGWAGTYSSLDCDSRLRQPMWQMSQCQRWPGTLEEVFQWWCFQCRRTTGAGGWWLGQTWLPDHLWFLEYCLLLGFPCLVKSLSNTPPPPPTCPLSHSLCSDWRIHLRKTPVSSLCPAWTQSCPGGPPGGHPGPLSLNWDHVLSIPCKWPFHLTFIYSLPVSQGGLWPEYSGRRQETFFKSIAIALDFYMNHDMCVLRCFSQVRLLAALWTIAYQASLSMKFFRKEYWSGLPCPRPKGSSQPRDQTCISYVSTSTMVQYVFFFFLLVSFLDLQRLNFLCLGFHSWFAVSFAFDQTWLTLHL